MRKYFYKFRDVWTKHLSPNISKTEKFIYIGIGMLLSYVSLGIIFGLILKHF